MPRQNVQRHGNDIETAAIVPRETREDSPMPQPAAPLPTIETVCLNADRDAIVESDSDQCAYPGLLRTHAEQVIKETEAARQAGTLQSDVDARVNAARKEIEDLELVAAEENQQGATIIQQKSVVTTQPVGDPAAETDDIHDRGPVTEMDTLPTKSTTKAKK